MTELAACPRCGDALDIPVELLGKPVRCASCNTVFTPTAADAIPTAPRARRSADRPRPSPFDDYDEPTRPKSNGWVWVVMLLLVLLFGGLVMVCTGWMGRIVNPKMTVHESAEGKFRVALPGTPTPVTRNDDQGRPVIGLQAVRTVNQETYLVLSAELPAAAKKVDLSDDTARDELLAELARRHLPGLAAGTEARRQTQTVSKNPTLDVMFHQGGGLMKQVTVVRLVVANGRVYLLSVQGGNLEPHMWYVRRFFNSFEPGTVGKE